MSNETLKSDEREYFRGFLARVYKAPFLTTEEETAIVERMKTGGTVGQKARDRLITSHLRMVSAMAIKMRPMRINLDEMIQEGTIGLLQAADKFALDRGCRFSTYAWWWVREALHLYLRRQGGGIQIPHLQQKKLAAFEKAVGKLAAEGKALTDENIAQVMEIPVKSVRDIAEVRMLTHMVSLNRPVGDENATELGDLITDQQQKSAEDLLLEEESHGSTADLVAVLNERERKIINMRFGLEGENESTLDQVSQVFHISRERVRQIEVKALKKMRLLLPA